MANTIFNFCNQVLLLYTSFMASSAYSKKPFAQQPFAWREAMIIDAVPVAREILTRVPLASLDLDEALNHNLTQSQVDIARGFFKLNPDQFYKEISETDKPAGFLDLSHEQKLQALLIHDLANTKLVFYHSETPEKGSCAKTTLTERPSIIKFYLKNCDRDVESLFRAASFLVGETFHHFNFPDATMDAYRHAYEKAFRELDPERAKALSVVRLPRGKDYRKIIEEKHLRAYIIHKFSDIPQNKYFFIGLRKEFLRDRSGKVLKDEMGNERFEKWIQFSVNHLSGYLEDISGDPGTGGLFRLNPDLPNVLAVEKLGTLGVKEEEPSESIHNFNCRSDVKPALVGSGDDAYEDWTHLSSLCYAPFVGNIYHRGREAPKDRIAKAFQVCEQKFPVSLKYFFDKEENLYGINVRIQKPEFIRPDRWQREIYPCGNHGLDGRQGELITESNFFIL